MSGVQCCVLRCRVVKCGVVKFLPSFHSFLIPITYPFSNPHSFLTLLPLSLTSYSHSSPHSSLTLWPPIPHTHTLSLSLALARAVGRDILWKPLNHRVLLVTRDNRKSVRIGAIKTLHKLFVEVTFYSWSCYNLIYLSWF